MREVSQQLAEHLGINPDNFRLAPDRQGGNGNLRLEFFPKSMSGKMLKPDAHTTQVDGIKPHIGASKVIVSGPADGLIDWVGQVVAIKE